MSKFSEFNILKIKKNFADPGTLLSAYTTAIGTTYSGTDTTAPYVFTDTSGVKELIITVTGTANVGAGLKVCFAAPDNATAKLWLDDTDTDAFTLQYAFVPVNETQKFTFENSITRWDIKAVASVVAAYQRKSR